MKESSTLEWQWASRTFITPNTTGATILLLRNTPTTASSTSLAVNSSVAAGTGLNGTLMIRGAKADYDEWEELGNPGWGWKDVLPLFNKSEKFIPTEGFEAAPEFHGTDGPLQTTVHPLAPVSEALLESYIDQGFEYKPDMFVTGEAEGVGHVVRTVHNGIRTSGADFVNHDPPSNLHVLLNTTVLRVVLEPVTSTTTTTTTTDDSDSPTPSSTASEPQWKAVAIEAESKSPSPSSDPSSSTETETEAPKTTLITFRATKEIIVSAGSYNSPFILMHSGIGPKEHLNEFGIESKVNLRGVGRNLADHLIVFQFYALKSNMTYDHLIYPPGALDLTVKEWIEKKFGIMGRFPFGPFAFKRVDELMKDKPEWKAAKEANPDADPMGQKADQPHIEYFSTALYGGGPQHPHLPTKESDSSFALITMLFGPQSRGSVQLSSADPHDKPIIDHNYLATDLDVAVLAEGTRYGHQVVINGAGTKEHIAGAWPSTRVHPEGDEEWKEYVRQQAGTCYHPSSTCKMGPDSDTEAVVDPRLRVRDVKGLCVADVSIMPKLNNGHTQAPAYMIGEKAALLILEDHAIRA